MKNEQKNIIVSGFGGQGVLFLGTVISHAAIIENKNTTWIPSYGAQMRGGAANCFVIVSNSEIASPVFDSADFGIFLSSMALLKFENIIEPNGLIFSDSSFINETKRHDVNFFFKPFSDIIVEGDKKLLLNIVVLGAFIKKTGLLMKDNVIYALRQICSKKGASGELVKLNLDSFEFGFGLC